jgi:hypothetical protein
MKRRAIFIYPYREAEFWRRTTTLPFHAPSKSLRSVRWSFTKTPRGVSNRAKD